MRKQLFGACARHFGKKIPSEVFKRAGSHVYELALVKLRMGASIFLSQFQALICDSRLTTARSSFWRSRAITSRFCHAVQQASHVPGRREIMRFGDSVAGKAFGTRAAQNTKDVVLGRGQPVGL